MPAQTSWDPDQSVLPLVSTHSQIWHGLQLIHCDQDVGIAHMAILLFHHAGILVSKLFSHML